MFESVDGDTDRVQDGFVVVEYLGTSETKNGPTRLSQSAIPNTVRLRFVVLVSVDFSVEFQGQTCEIEDVTEGDMLSTKSDTELLATKIPPESCLRVVHLFAIRPRLIEKLFIGGHVLAIRPA